MKRKIFKKSKVEQKRMSHEEEQNVDELRTKNSEF